MHADKEKALPGGSAFSELSSCGGLDSSAFIDGLPEYQAQILARRDRARLLARFAFRDGGRRA